MAIFYFHLRDGNSGVVDNSGAVDDEGQELRSALAARDHAVQTVRELMRQRELETRHYRMYVIDEYGAVIAELPFATVDSTLDYLEPDQY